MWQINNISLYLNLRSLSFSFFLLLSLNLRRGSLCFIGEGKFVLGKNINQNGKDNNNNSKGKKINPKLLIPRSIRSSIGAAI